MILRPGINKELNLETLIKKYGAAVECVNSSTIPFFLTGSWAFGTWNRRSDLDLYTADNPQTATWLLDHAANEMPMHSEYGGDPILKRLFQIGKVHVQFVNPLDMKHKVQSLFEELPEEIRVWAFGRKLSKIGRRNIWHIALHLMGCSLPQTKTIAANPHTCKLCGSPGVDLAVSFYCTNPQCRNYKP